MRGTPSSGFGGKLPRPDGARRRDGSAREKSGSGSARWPPGSLALSLFFSSASTRGGRPVASSRVVPALLAYPFFSLLREATEHEMEVRRPEPEAERSVAMRVMRP
jgi:hypothetical protein